MCTTTETTNNGETLAKAERPASGDDAPAPTTWHNGAQVPNHKDQAAIESNERVVKKILGLMMLYNFLVALMKESNPIVSVFLVVNKGWTPGRAGVVWFTKDISALISSAFIGSVVDKSEQKRLLLALSTAALGLAIASIVWTQNFAFLVAKSVLEGVAQSFVIPCKSALVLGLVGQHRFDEASVKNEMLDHSGCLAGIAIVGTMAYFIYPDVESVFYVFFAFAALAAASLFFIPMMVTLPDGRSQSRICQKSSRNLGESEEASSRISVLLSHQVVIFAIVSFTFHLSNAAILPLLSQIIAQESGRGGLAFAAANVALAQVTSIFSAGALGASSKRFGYILPITVGMALAAPVRCGVILALEQLAPNRWALLATQLLDGVGVGIWGLALLVMAKNLTVGTGHFSFTIGYFSTCHLVGAALSNLITGYIVTFTSYAIGFAFLAAVGIIPVILVPFINLPSEEDQDISQESKHKRRSTTCDDGDDDGSNKSTRNTSSDKEEEGSTSSSSDDNV